MITIFIDNTPYQVRPDQNLLQACLSLGFDLPYFCWHPALHAVGACRQCAVKQFKDEHDTRGKIIMSCMTPATEGMRISVDDPDARAFRKGVIEWLMLNHPHDCPVCDEGGECHLQDMTVMTGHAYRRTRFKKRTHQNQYLGPFVNHEMNRCIQCYRCVRFYREYAGGRDLNVFGAHDHVYFGRHEDGVLENEFSGNLVEICPTGVFTDKTLKQHYTRKWDLQTAPSICMHCGLGCNTIAGERDRSLRRITNRYHHEVNGYFLCDRGRFGYEFVNSDKRIRSASISTPPSFRREDREKASHPVGKKAAVTHIAEILAKSKGIIGIGSPRASLESNYALRTLVGPENFYSGISDAEHALVSRIIDILRRGPTRPSSLHDVRNANAVLVLGEDVTNTAPLLALSLRQSVRLGELDAAAKLKIPKWQDAGVRNAGQGAKSPLYIASVTTTKLDDVSTRTYQAAPDDIARLGFAIAHELDPDTPEVADLDASIVDLVREIAQTLKKAKRPLIVSGTSLLSEAVVMSAANVAAALARNSSAVSLCYTVPECNSMGSGIMGGRNLGEAFTVMEDGLADTVIILENDLYRRGDGATIDAFLGKAKHIVVLDHLVNATTARSDVVLPAGTFAESHGTLVNNEGRAQRSFQVCGPQGDIQASWKWISDIMEASGRPAVGGTHSYDALVKQMVSVLPVLAPVSDIAPAAEFRIRGSKVPRQPHRYSGRTAMLANLNMHEQKPPEDPDSPLAFSMEGYEGRPPLPLISRYWSPGWNSVQALNKPTFAEAVRPEGEDAGRLFPGPRSSGPRTYFDAVPETFTTRPGTWLLVPLYHLFGSEELSVQAAGIAALAAGPYLSLGPRDAELLNVSPGYPVELLSGGTRIQCRVAILPGLRPGMAGYPAGVLPLGRMSNPAFGSIVKRSF
jgi:NADH-quinone oxidoreductase subunit G